MTLSHPSIAEIRAQFPGLRSDFAFLENAGGAHMPRQSLDRMREFVTTDYVQTGSPYPASQRTTQLAKDAHQFLNLLFNGDGIGHVAIGPSTTALIYMLANCMTPDLKPGDEVIISVANHESNIGPWARLERLGVKVVWWPVDPVTGLSDLTVLQGHINERTKVVAFSRTSNLIGDQIDVKRVTELAHRVGAVVVADVVAAASHEAMDVRVWGCDFAVLSNYKVYGPHTAAMFGRTEAWAKLDGPNHFFISPDGSAARFELGCLSYEGLAAIMGLGDYLKFLTGDPDAPVTRELISGAFRIMSELERPIRERFVTFLNERYDLRVIGQTDPTEDRHPTFSFVHSTKSSAEICQAVCDRGFGIKSGHMYAYRLCEALGIPTHDGVVRVSAVHYNSMDEIERLITVLQEVL